MAGMIKNEPPSPPVLQSYICTLVSEWLVSTCLPLICQSTAVVQQNDVTTTTPIMTSHIVVQNRFGGVRSAQRSVVHWRDHLRHAWADGIGACGRDRGDDLSFGEAARKGGSRASSSVAGLSRQPRLKRGHSGHFFLCVCTLSCAAKVGNAHPERWLSKETIFFCSFCLCCRPALPGVAALGTFCTHSAFSESPQQYYFVRSYCSSCASRSSAIQP